MSRVIAAILLIAVLAVGGGIIATTAYNAGVTAAAVADGTGTAVTPVVVPAYGYGWHPYGWGFGFFGFLFFLFFLFLVFGLIRAIFWRGGPGRRGGWGGPGGYYGWKDPNGHGTSPWQSRAHDTFEDWHRQAHGEPQPKEPGAKTDPPSSTGIA